MTSGQTFLLKLRSGGSAERRSRSLQFNGDIKQTRKDMDASARV